MFISDLTIDVTNLRGKDPGECGWKVVGPVSFDGTADDIRIQGGGKDVTTLTGVNLSDGGEIHPLTWIPVPLSLLLEVTGNKALIPDHPCGSDEPITVSR